MAAKSVVDPAILGEAIAAVKTSSTLLSAAQRQYRPSRQFPYPPTSTVSSLRTPIGLPVFNPEGARVRLMQPPEAPRLQEARSSLAQSWAPVATVPVTIHKFPSLEPVGLQQWSVQHLYLPLRRDILHSAVVYEADMARQGSAFVRNRYEMPGSSRKIQPQKGTGRARRGDAKSPLLKGGGKSFGPHPRDFSTKLNRKVYDKAWRTALSYRYRQGELIVCNDNMEMPMPLPFKSAGLNSYKDGLRETFLKKYAKGVLESRRIGRNFGRTLFITRKRRDLLFEAMELLPSEGAALHVDEVDVRDVLQMGRVVMEEGVLGELMERHQSDLVGNIIMKGTLRPPPPLGSSSNEGWRD